MLENLEPKSVFHFFEEITQIPRGSYNMTKICNYMTAFARERHLTYIQDDMCNVIIYKDGSEGYEDSPPVILQGHMDMVAVKDPDCWKDLTVDGLDLLVEDDLIRAQGTSLGGDDGIALAYGLALLDDDSIPHPPLEVVFTADEEVGMTGAEFLDVSVLKGRTLLNIDSEDEGVFTVSCAGGATVVLQLPGATEEEDDAVAVEFYFDHFKGGHSGTKIAKGRANPNILLGRILSKLVDFSKELRLISVNGGTQDNAIPTFAGAVVAVPKEEADQVTQIIEDEFASIKEEYHKTDPKAKLKVSVYAAERRPVYTREATERVAELLNKVPNGVQSMNPNVEGMVETSLNLGILMTDEDGIRLTFCVRSASEEEKDALVNELCDIAETLGGIAQVQSSYPGWDYREDSRVREIMVRIYEEQYGKEPVIEGIHAGLECGMFAAKIPDLDAISFGPQMYHVHTTEEELSISSTQRTWELLLATLKALK